MAFEPVVSVWDELSGDLTNEKVVTELALGFEDEGNLLITRGTGSADINLKVTVAPQLKSVSTE